MTPEFSVGRFNRRCPGIEALTASYKVTAATSLSTIPVNVRTNGAESHRRER